MRYFKGFFYHKVVILLAFLKLCPIFDLLIKNCSASCLSDYCFCFETEIYVTKLISAE